MRKPDQLFDFTVRCNRSEFRLVPTKERSDIVGFWLAKAQKRFPGVLIHAVCALSNHLHLVVRDLDGQLSMFAQYFLGQAAKGINRLDRVRGPVFERRFAEIAIVDTSAFISRVAYVVCNPVEANLVRSHREWTGLCLFSGVEPATRRFTIFHETRYRDALADAKRTGAHVDRKDFYETAELEIAPLDPELACSVGNAIDQREAMLRRQQTSVVGMRRVVLSSPFDRPEVSARSRMPLCFASTREARFSFIESWSVFVCSFRRASALFRSGVLDVVFPMFSFRPSTSTA